MRSYGEFLKRLLSNRKNLKYEQQHHQEILEIPDRENLILDAHDGSFDSIN